MIARWSGTLMEISKTLSEEEGRKFTTDILERFENRS